MSLHASRMFYLLFTLLFSVVLPVLALHIKFIKYSDAWVPGYLPASATASPQQTGASEKGWNFSLADFRPDLALMDQVARVRLHNTRENSQPTSWHKTRFNKCLSFLPWKKLFSLDGHRVSTLRYLWARPHKERNQSSAHRHFHLPKQPNLAGSACCRILGLNGPSR